MTHFLQRPVLQRSALILLATSALAACAGTPVYPIAPAGAAPPAQPIAPPAAIPQAPPPAPYDAGPQTTRPPESVDARELNQLPPARPPEPRAAPPVQAAPPPPPSEPTYRTVTTRTVTGRVVDVDGPAKTYEVKSGDNLEKIARTLDTTVDKLKSDNDLASSLIKPGQKLKGPSSDAKAYVVGSGDTLSAIGRRFGVTVQALTGENEISRDDVLRPGARLRLPSGFDDKGPQTATTRVAVDPPAPTRMTQPAPQRTPERVPEPPFVAAPNPDSAPAPFSAPPPPPPPPPKPAPKPEPPPPALPSSPRPYSSLPGARTGPVAGPVAAAPVADAEISRLGRGRFEWPVRGEVISTFGPKEAGQRNDGLNIRAGAGDTVRAAAAGDVVYAGDQVPGFGNLVLIKHADGWVTAYGHLSRVDVKMQQRVTQGQQIGQAGATGGASETQLHFEVRYAPSPLERARPIDPALVLPK